MHPEHHKTIKKEKKTTTGGGWGMFDSIAAAHGGDKKAKENRDIAANRMTPADISKAQKLAREWMAEHPPQ